MVIDVWYDPNVRAARPGVSDALELELRRVGSAIGVAPSRWFVDTSSSTNDIFNTLAPLFSPGEALTINVYSHLARNKSLPNTVLVWLGQRGHGVQPSLIAPVAPAVKSSPALAPQPIKPVAKAPVAPPVRPAAAAVKGDIFPTKPCLAGLTGSLGPTSSPFSASLGDGRGLGLPPSLGALAAPSLKSAFIPDAIGTAMKPFLGSSASALSLAAFGLRTDPSLAKSLADVMRPDPSLAKALASVMGPSPSAFDALSKLVPASAPSALQALSAIFGPDTTNKRK